MTQFLFRDDSYLQSTDATILEVIPDGALVLDRTVFYAASGGQPGDSGTITLADGTMLTVTTAIHPEGDKARIAHVVDGNSTAMSPGEKVVASIDWDRRHRLMRMHTALHLLSVILPFPVTGGSIGEDKGRLDFDMPDVPEDTEALERRLNDLVAADHAVSQEWITDQEMTANPNLVKTMNVKPPMGHGRVRLIRIGDVDLQPCGGTHVQSTAEIGRLKLGKIEKKGKQNRRVSLLFAEG